jgi:hypothetical protein
VINGNRIIRGLLSINAVHCAHRILRALPVPNERATLAIRDSFGLDARSHRKMSSPSEVISEMPNQREDPVEVCVSAKYLPS